MNEYMTLKKPDGGQLLFATPSRATRWRVESFFTKEPITLEWIAGFKRDEILFDIGANVGMYSIWAAATRGVQVFAFEPEAFNYAILNRNIYLNSLSVPIMALCVGMDLAPGFTRLNLSSVEIGGSCHSLGAELDFRGQPMKPVFTQGIYATSVDTFVDDCMIAPDHIKIDVDGIEPHIIEGSCVALNGVDTMLIEVNWNLAVHREMVDFLLSRGFRYDQAQVNAAKRKSGAFEGVGECVFYR